MAISCHQANCCCRAKEPLQQHQQQQQQHPSNMLPLADRSLNKITFKFNCRGPISSPQPRDAGLLQSNLLLLLCLCGSNKLLSILPFVPQKAAPENLEPATWNRPYNSDQMGGGIRDRVIKVNLAAIYRHICFAVAVAAAAVASAGAATSVARRPAQRSCRHLLLPLVQLN
uniref:HDC09523 n=1 Tax=Drosophila melanogaster TaxID=7227 RepID=Q6ILE4_DROME|nr:TPA_inf: HDC09523 [Drosophila melanogaster]